MLDAAEALFLGGRNEDSVADERRRGVAVEGVEAEDMHARCWDRPSVSSASRRGDTGYQPNILGAPRSRSPV